MSVKNYKDFIFESQFVELILESKLVYSKKVINLLNKMKSNRVASVLLDLYTKDVSGISQNYIEITDNKEEVTFTPDRKAQEILKDKPETWKVIDSGRYLTNSDRNDRIFQALGYDKAKYGCWSPEVGAVGLILSETVSSTSGNIYAMFQEYNTDDPKIGVINKLALEITDSEDQRIWSTSRNPIRIGRLVRAILNSAKISFTDKDIEDFTNQWKATYDFAKDALRQFDIIQGGRIAYWYDNNNYVKGGGTLNSSCMAEVESDYFDIYTDNPSVSLVILYSDDGTIGGDKYISSKIKGRAILWDAKINGVDRKFMDRIYTKEDSDVGLFKQFAEKNGWWYKVHQNMDPSEAITDGDETISDPSIKVELKYTNFTYFPYIDTMCYLNEIDKHLYNYQKGQGLYLKDTGGSYDTYNNN